MDFNDVVNQSPAKASLESALVLTYGGLGVALKVADSYPFKSWKDVTDVKEEMVKELTHDRIGRGPLWPPMPQPKRGRDWWQFWK